MEAGEASTIIGLVAAGCGDPAGVGGLGDIGKLPMT